jgi:hypothetical protein
MAIVQQIAIVAGTIGQLPAVDDGALHIDQVGAGVRMGANSV